MKKQPKERIIYDNYDVSAMYDEARAFLLEDHTEEEITDSMVWDEVYFQDSINWDDEHAQLKEFFTGHGYFLLMGSVGRWNGRYEAGYVFDDFDDMFYKAIKDCDYWKIWDENGHFYLKCSHHDGTNFFEIKRITYKAVDFLENWENDKDEAEKHNIIWNSNFLSSLPHYAHTVFGYPKREAVKE